MPIDPKFLKAEELGIRLGVVSGLPMGGTPVWKHQKASDRIRSAVGAKSRLELHPVFTLVAATRAPAKNLALICLLNF